MLGGIFHRSPCEADAYKEPTTERRRDPACERQVLRTAMHWEYQTYLVSKEQLIQTIKESHKQVIRKLETFTFPILETYLSKNFINKEHKQKYTCDICKIYVSFKLKGMAAHKKGCKRKLPVIP